MFCKAHAILDWYSRENGIENKISKIIKHLKASSDDTIEIDISNDNNQNEFIEQEILVELKNNKELKDQIDKINKYINSKKEQVIIDEVLTLKTEKNTNMLFLYIIELPSKIFEYIIRKIHSKENDLGKQMMKMDLD